MLRRRLSMVVIGAMLATVTVAAPTAGARPSSTGPTLSGPSAVRVGETYTVNGSGFAPGSWVPLEITEAGGCCLALGMVADEAGSFSYTGPAWMPGTYRVRAAVQRNGNGRWRIVAECTFDVYP
jgi:hypothetical protein